MLIDIPVSFTYQDKEYGGLLSRVSGAGTTGGMWYLMVNKYYWGTLMLVDGSWRFNNPKGDMGHLAEHFGYAVAAALDSQ